MAKRTNDKSRITKRAPTKPKSRLEGRPGRVDRVPTDVLLAIKAEHLANIASRKKNHEYRKYRLPDGVERLWLYETANGRGKVSITHIAVIPGSARRVPGQVPTEPPGIGNDDFNAGLKQSRYGYPILGLYELVQPVTPVEMKSKWNMGAPMGWRYVSSELWADRWGKNIDRELKVKRVF
ncbi:putative pua protein [Rosellinia necatrix]|uniref:Putative pua protein n=1 Tax=Rosellinia necatrix TaxID=77044 RepID=A0A1W2TUT7_ROSNE|nr:putative pua protein [Rosellinia necatrix]